MTIAAFSGHTAPQQEQLIAWFITPHGFGHATRAVAVMAALRELDPTARFHVFTRAPAWLFAQTLEAEAFTRHDALTDIGLAQRTSLREDLDQTVAQLSGLLPFRPALVRSLADQTLALGCRLVVCDVAALGIAVARQAGLPCALVENFTWDWIYEGYAHREPRLRPFIDLLRDEYARVDARIQTEPVCAPVEAACRIPPIGRRPRATPQDTRARLGVPRDARLVLITMGGVAHDHAFLPRLAEQPDVFFVIPTQSAPGRPAPNVLLLAQTADIYHPDLVHACDAVVGKNGYSTMAEVYASGAPFGYVMRPGFRESEVIAAFIDQHMPALRFTADEFDSGAWLARLPELLALPRRRASTLDGAAQAARHILALL